jgi:hypothetical protein
MSEKIKKQLDEAYITNHKLVIGNSSKEFVAYDEELNADLYKCYYLTGNYNLAIEFNAWKKAEEFIINLKNQKSGSVQPQDLKIFEIRQEISIMEMDIDWINQIQTKRIDLNSDDA